MLFPEPLLEGRLVRRYKRFLADVTLPDGQVVIAHCPNPGAMQSCSPVGARVWLTRHRSTTRRLAYTWELVETEHALVCVNTGRANDVVAEALQEHRIAELAGWDRMAREVAYGEGSRIDLLLHHGERACYVEVKSVSLRVGDGVAAFPDAVTARGTKHLVELMDMVARGHRAVLLFCCSRTDARAVRPADEIDPLYCGMLRVAARVGVEILAYRCDVSERGLWLGERVPVELPELPELPGSVEQAMSRLRSAARASVKRGVKKTVRLRPARA